MVQPALSPDDLFRKSSSVLHVELPARANYAISAPELLTLSIPPVALASNSTPLAAPTIVLEAEGGLAHASGSLLTHLHEEDLRSQPLELNLTLTRDEWVPLLEEKFAHQLIDALRSDSEEPNAWARVVARALRPRDVTRVDAHHVTIALGQRSEYDIAAPERLHLVVPAACVVSNQQLRVGMSLVVLPQPGTAAIAGGSLLAASNEVALRSARSHTLLLEVHNDTFRDAAVQYDMGGGVFSQLRLGLRTSEHEPLGWGQVVQPALEHRLWAVGNRSTLLTVTILQAAAYDVSAPEFLSVSIPPGALTSRQRVHASNVLRIDATRGVAELYHQSTFVLNATEAALRSATPLSVVVLLRGDSFLHNVGTDDDATAALLAGFRSAQDDGPAGWSRVVQPALDFRSVTRLSSTALRIDLRQFAQYSIACVGTRPEPAPLPSGSPSPLESPRPARSFAFESRPVFSDAPFNFAEIQLRSNRVLAGSRRRSSCSSPRTPSAPTCPSPHCRRSSCAPPPGAPSWAARSWPSRRRRACGWAARGSRSL